MDNFDLVALTSGGDDAPGGKLETKVPAGVVADQGGGDFDLPIIDDGTALFARTEVLGAVEEDRALVGDLEFIDLELDLQLVRDALSRGLDHGLG